MSGSTAGGLIGGVIGFFAGNPQLGFMIGSAVGGYLDPAQIEGPRLRDAQVQTSDEGVPRPIIYGVYAVAGNLIQRGPLIERKKTERAGKGGPEQTTYRYFMSYAIRICEGPGRRVLRVWRDDKLVYDVRPGSTFNADSAAFATKITFYDGGETQLPDPTLEALPAEYGGGVGNVSAYRGTCYAVFENDDLTDRNGTIPQYRFEVASAATEAPSVCSPSWILSSNDYSSSGAVLLSTDPTDLSGTIDVLASVDNSEATHVIDCDDTIVLTGGSGGRVFRSFDYGATWSAGADLAAGYLQPCPAFLMDRLWIGQGLEGYDVLAPPFSSATRAGDPPRLGWFVEAAGRVCSGSIYDDNAYSTDDLGAEWTASAQTIPYTSASAASDGATIVVIGKKGATTWFGSKSTDGGLTFESFTVPAFGGTGGDETYLGYHEDSGWVLVCRTSGNIWYGNSPENLTQSADSAVGAFALAFGDGVWVIVGSGGLCKTSEDDGETWTTRATSFGSANITGVAYLGGMPGTEIPDAPGFYVQEDGSILQRCTSAELAPDAVILSTVVQDIAERVGLDASEHLSIAALTDTLTGYALSRQMPASEAIKPLQQIYLFDFPEWDLKLRAVKRGGAIVKTLTDDDFIQDDSDEEVRGQAVEFPKKLHLYHADPNANYAIVPATTSRVSRNVKATGETSIEAPLSLTRDEAAPKSAIQMKVAWEELQGRLERKLPAYVHADLVPSDCIGFDSKRWRITKTEAFEGTLAIEAVRDRASNYESNATPNEILAPTPPPSNIAGPTMFAALNLPRLRSSDTGPGMYIAVTGVMDGWKGADLYLSVDGGVTEQLVATILQPATMGTLLEDITADDEPLVVRLYGDAELDSVTLDQLVARQNAAAVTSSAVSEILQFQTADEDSNGDYTLTDLFRGELHTDAAEHNPGDGFVLLDGTPLFLPLDVGLAGVTLIFRPVSRGTVPANNPTYSVVFDPQFIGSPVVEAYTDDLDETYTDNNGNSYSYEVPDEVP